MYSNKRKELSNLIGVFFILIMINSCSYSITPTSTSKNGIRADQIPSSTPRPIYLNSPVAYAPMPVTPTNKILSTPTANRISQSPITVTPNINQINNLLRNKPDCQRPCIMGIIPGITTITDLQNLTTRWGLSIFPDPNFGPDDQYSVGYDFYKSQTDKDMSFDLNIEVTDRIIMSINYSFETNPTKPVSKENWLAFQPEKILQTYGKPSQILYYVLPPHEAPIDHEVTYQIFLFFDQIDTVVEYDSSPIKGSENGYYQICPGKDNYSNNRIWMGRSKKGVPSLDKRFFLENNSDLNAEKFTELLIEQPDRFCFRLKAGKVEI